MLFLRYCDDDAVPSSADVNALITAYKQRSELPNGKWTSKLGRWEDIEHEIEGLMGEMYGDVKQILKRPIN